MTIPATATDSAPNANIGRLYYLAFTIPAGTLISAPVSQTWPLEDNYLVSINTRIPPGPSGLMGFRILWSQQQIVPWGNNSWLTADDEEINWPSNTAISTSALTVQGYNTGIYPHTVYLRGLVSTLPPAVQSAVNQETGTVALPASETGALTVSADNFVAPDQSAIDLSLTPDELAAEQQSVEPEINPSISLVSAT